MLRIITLEAPRHGVAIALLAALFCLFAVGNGLCAPTAESIRQQEQIIRGDEDRQRQLERQHKEMQERRQGGIDIGQQNATSPEGEDTLCVQIKTITLSGATLLSAAERTGLTEPYVGRCLSMRQLNELVRDVTNLYIAKGYTTTRAYLEPQDLSTGALTITVVEGAIEGIRLNEDTQGDRLRVLTAFPGLVGRPLYLRDLEQGLDQLNRLPSSNAKMAIEPGAREGTSRIVIKDQRDKTWRVRANVDNSGQKSTGVNQYTLSLDKDNLLGLNDVLTFNWNADADTLASFERHKSESSSFFYSVPLGYWTFTASANYFDYHTSLEGGGVAYLSTGNTTTYTFDVNRVLHRDADSKTSAGVSFITKDVNNFLEHERLRASSYDLSILRASANHSQRLLGGVLNAGVEYNLGLPVLDAPKDKTTELSAPKHEFYKLVFTGGYTRPFAVQGHELTFSTRGQLQWTPDTLYNSERLSLGSRYTVRGFQQDSLSGDSGGYVRNELSTPVLPEKRRPAWLAKTLGVPQAYLGYDAGFIHKDETDTYERGTLQGLALGLRASGERFATDLCLSRALDAPDFMKNRDWELYWTFSIKV